MYLIFMLTCILLTIQPHGTWTKSENGDIDEFIQRLIKSDKFDELAVMIAEKAARKIFDLDKTVLHYKKAKKEELPIRSKHNLFESKENFQHKGIKRKQNKRFKDELNTKEIPDKGTLPNRQLRLKFKNLSRVSRGNVNSKQKGDNKDKETLISRIEITNSEQNAHIKIKNGKQLHKSRFKKVNNQYEGTNELKLKSKSYMSSDHKNNSNEEKNGELTDNMTGDGDKITNDSNADKSRSSEEKENKSILIETSEGVVKNNSEHRENKINQNTNSNERNESKNQTKSFEYYEEDTLTKPKEVSNEYLVSKGEERDTMEKEKDSKDVRKIYSMTTKKLIIRKEGDKLFAFENLDDYREYQEKVTRQNIETKEI